MDPKRIASRIARKTDTISAVVEIVSALVPPVLLHDALGLAIDVARRARDTPREELYRAAAMRAAGADVVAMVALMAATARHRASSSDGDFQLGVIKAVSMGIRHLPSDDPSALLAAGQALAVARLAARSGREDAEAMEIDLRAQWASRAVEAGNNVERLAGLETYRRIVADYETTPAVRRVLFQGTVEHNLARMLLHAPGDPGVDLPEARELLDRALTREDRRTDPGQEAFTRSELSLVLARLAQLESTAADHVALLTQAVANAERAERLVMQHGGQLDPRDARRARRRREVELGEATKDRERLLRVKAELDAEKPDPTDPREASLRLALGAALGDDDAMAEDLDGMLLGAVTKTQRTGRLDLAGVKVLIHCLLNDRPRVPARRASVARLVAYVDPEHVGLPLARLASEAEIVWILEEPERAVRVEWIRQSFGWVQGQLAEIQRPLTERRFFGACVRALVGALLFGSPEHDPIELAVLVDHMGAAAYRADSAFFGRSAITSRADAAWVRNLFLTRISLDLEAERADPQLDPDDPDSPVTCEPSLREMDDGSMERLDRHAGQAVVDERAELAMRWRRGVSQGWATEYTVPGAERADLESWLRTHPTVGFLVAAPPIRADEPAAVFVLAASEDEVHHVPLTTLDGDDVGRLMDLATALLEPPRYRATQDGPTLTIDEAMKLSPDERQRLVPDGLDASDIARADDIVNELLDRARPLGREVAEVVRRLGLTSLRILGRGPFAWFPWEGIPLDEDPSGLLLGEVVALVHVATLAPVPGARRPGHGSLAIVGARENVGRGLGAATRAIVGREGTILCAPIRSEAMEAEMARASVVRFVGHGAYVPHSPMMSGLELDESDRASPDLRYQACGARGADLRSVERFEICACEGAGGFDMRGYHRGEDEPTSIASALLVGGARRVVAAPWVQVAGMVAVIGGHFVRQPETCTAEADARRLAMAVRAMRTTLADLDPGRPVPEWFLTAMNEMLGPVAREPRLAGSALVGPWSYVGWRVTARDRDC